MDGRKRVVVVAATCLVFVASVIAAGAMQSLGSQSPDRPPFAQEADGDYLQLRDQYFAHLRGLDPGLYADPSWRTSALEVMQRQQKAAAKVAASAGTPAWGQVGPVLVANGQELGGSDTAISGRVTAVAVDPTNSNKVYLGTAQGGVWRTVDGGATWTPIFDSAQSLSIGALALAPSSPTTLYVGTGEGNFSCDSFFGVGLYRIDNADTSATMVGPLNKDGGAADVFSGRSISSILVDPTNAATIFVSSLDGLSGVGCNQGANFPTRGVYRSTNATGAAPSVTFTRLSVQPTADLAVTGMTFVNGDPNILLAAVFGTSGTNGGIWRTTNALDSVPTFIRTFAVQSDHTSFAVSGSTVLAAADENGLGGRLRESTDGGATWPTLLSAANGFCGGQCFYDLPVAIDPRTSGSSLRIYLGGNAGTGAAAGMKVSNNNGASFAVDQTGLHADAHALTIDASTNPSTVWAGNDGGVWKRAANASAGTTWTNLNRGLGTVQFESVAVGKSDAAFGIGGTQDNGTQLQSGHVGSWSQADFGDGGYALVDQSTTSTSNVTMYHTYFNSQNSLLGFARTNTAACAIKGGWAGRGFGFGSGGVACDGTTADAANGIVGTDDVEFYAPMALGPDTPNEVYYGTTRLYRSANKGDTMTTVSQAPISGSTNPITAIGISPASDNVRIVGLENGQVWATTTGSSTLAQMTGLTAPANATGGSNKWVGRAVIDPNNADIAYVTFAYYAALGSGLNVFKTTNLSAVTPTWAAAATGIPDVPVNGFVVDPQDSTHLYAGTDVGVYASTDSGATWAPFGTGLPAVAVFDLAIVRPGTANESLRVATHGRGMWEASLSGDKLDQTIVGFGAIPAKTFGAADFTVDAPASSGLPVSFGATGTCTVTGGTVHLTGVGSCTITASQAGNATFNAAPGVPQTFSIAKASQTIAFGSLPGKTFGDADFAVSASATSGLAVSFGATGSCTVAGSTVHLTGAGSCTITASQAGNGTFNAAADVPQTFAIAKAGQSITFAALAAKTFGDADFAVSATASSGLAVSFGASGSCTVAGATVHITGAGSCTVTASQAGNTNINAAANVPQTFAIGKAGQTITFGALADRAAGSADFTVSATASSGLAVSFGASGSCTVSGTTVHITGAGSCTITAAQPGDANFNAATSVARSFTIAPGSPAAKKCKVPKVVGKTLAAAKRALKARHCGTGKVRRSYSKRVKKGRVSSQSRRAGKVFRAGTKVNLVVSRGRKR